jgi:hypothetical protein
LTGSQAHTELFCVSNINILPTPQKANTERLTGSQTHRDKKNIINITKQQTEKIFLKKFKKVLTNSFEGCIL